MIIGGFLKDMAFLNIDSKLHYHHEGGKRQEIAMMAYITESALRLGLSTRRSENPHKTSGFGTLV
jgi:hypothetical protein